MLSPVAERAKAARSAINAARKAGDLGDLPATVKISVRCEFFSMGSSIDVRLTGAPNEWVWVGGRPEGGASLTPEARAVAERVTAILAKHTGYSWGGVTINDATVGHVSKAGWTPGQD